MICSTSRTPRGGGGDEDIDVSPRPDFKVPPQWKNSPRDYDLLVQRLTKAIREIDPKTTIVVEGAYFGGMAVNFVWLRPTGDPNTIYSFHMYMPHEFNDQGGKPDRPAGVKYPSPKFGKKEMIESMKVVEDFQRKYNAGIYLGEFGPTRHAEPNGAMQYLEDLLAYSEAHGWHTAYQIYGLSAPRSLEMGPNSTKESGPVPGGTPRLAVMKKHWALNAKK